MLIRADVSWESLGTRHADAAMDQNDGGPGEPSTEAQTVKARAERDAKQTGRHKKVCLTDLVRIERNRYAVSLG